MTNTPALTADDRANKLAVEVVFSGDFRVATALIASAIREAEDAAYERAAGLADVSNTSDPYDYGGGWSDAADEIAKAIRTLKSQKD